MSFKEKFFLAVIAIAAILFFWNVSTPESNSHNVNININLKSDVPTSVNGVDWKDVGKEGSISKVLKVENGKL